MTGVVFDARARPNPSDIRPASCPTGSPRSRPETLPFLQYADQAVRLAFAHVAV
jgi:hypothetical protein